MKISWINFIGILLAIIFACSWFASKGIDEKQLEAFLFFISFIYIIFGSRKRFQNSIIRISSIFFVTAGVALSYYLIFSPIPPSSFIGLIFMPANFIFLFSFLGVVSLFLGLIVWIFNEVKDFRAKKV